MFSRLEGRKARAENVPAGSVAKMGLASKNNDPSAFRNSDVRFFQIGPSIESPNLRCCSGPRNGANTWRAFIDSSRKPKLNDPCHEFTPGLVVISTRPD